jgi:hypothetical protein
VVRETLAFLGNARAPAAGQAPRSSPTRDAGEKSWMAR